MAELRHRGSRPGPVRAESAHRRRAHVARAPVVVAVAAALAVGLLLGRSGARAAPPPAPPATGPVAAPASALSSSWFCAGATDTAHGEATGRLVVTNAGPRTLRASVTVLAARGSGRRARRYASTVAPGSRASLPESVRGGAAWVGAIVTLDGGDASVEEETTGPLGTTAQPCATSGSSTWYFANGATLVNADSEISLLNPYPAPAIVDLSFTTDQGEEQPGSLQAVVVPGDTLVAVDLRGALRRRRSIATTIRTTTGRVVAWKTDIVTPPAPHQPILGTKAAAEPDADPASPYPGVTVTLGAPTPSVTWAWPEGITEAGVAERYLIYDPGSRAAEVALAVHLDEGSAEPFDLTVGPGQVSTLSMATEARVPPGVGYSVTVRSRNGVPVVAERALSAGAPSRLAGIGELLGASRSARSWLVGAGDVSATLDEILSVASERSRPVRVTVERLTSTGRRPLPGLSAVRVGAHGQLEVDLARVVPGLDAPLVVTASAPVLVGRDLVGRGHGRGVALSLGVPISVGLSAP
jgi:hypothetical protein